MESDPATVAAALRGSGLEPVDARILLQHVLGVQHAALIAHPERQLSAPERSRYRTLVECRRHGEPVAYLIGWREFYGRPFRVDRSVLIPRPETELLIDLALARIDPGSITTLLDLGTGSGNVAITLALERPLSQVVGIDASAAAVAVAQSNARALGAANVRLVEGRWFAAVEDTHFDLIVSNPPYVAVHDPHLGRGDVRFEPGQALKAGSDGLTSIRQIVAAAARHLQPGGWLLLEHGHEQDEACRALLQAAGFAEVFTALDLAHRPRVSGGRPAG